MMFVFALTFGDSGSVGVLAAVWSFPTDGVIACGYFVCRRGAWVFVLYFVSGFELMFVLIVLILMMYCLIVLHPYTYIVC